MFWGQRLGSGVSLTLALLLLGGSQAGAATWRLTPTLEGSAEYTDNVRGAASGAESDLILTARPGFGLRGTGARLQLNLNASLGYEEFVDTDKLGGWNGTMTGAAQAEFVEDILFLDASTSLRRQTINRNAATAFSDRDVGGNQTDVFNIRVSPFVRFRVGQWVQSESRLSADYTTYDALDQNDDPAASTTVSDASVLTLSQVFSSGRKFQRFGWTLSGEDTRTRRDRSSTTSGVGDTFRRRNVTAEVSYAWERWFTPIVRVGYDSFDDNSLRSAGDDRDGPFWLVGFSSQPGPRTTFRVLGGRRFGGPSYEGSFTYRVSSALMIRGDYRESVTTQQELVANPFNFVGTDEFGNLIDTRTGLPLEPGDPAFDLTFADQVFRNRTFRVGFTGTRLRNTYSVSAFLNRRDGSGVTPRETTATGVSASYRRDLSPRLSLSLTGSVTDTTDNVTADSRNYRFSSTLSYELNDSLTTSLSVRRLDRDTSGRGENDVTENSMVVTLRKAF